MSMYSPEQIDDLIAERDRLRRELDDAQTQLAEWEAVIGMPLGEAVRIGHERVERGYPYDQTAAAGRVAKEMIGRALRSFR